MKIAAVASTEAGIGKATTSAGIGAFFADAGLRTLLFDLDPIQPSLSSYYPLIEEAQGGIYNRLTSNITDPQRIISETSIPNLSLIFSNDINNQLPAIFVKLQVDEQGCLIAPNTGCATSLSPCSGGRRKTAALLRASTSSRKAKPRWPHWLVSCGGHDITFRIEPSHLLTAGAS